MKKNELDMALLILQRINNGYPTLFDANDEVKLFTSRGFSKTRVAEFLWGMIGGIWFLGWVIEKIFGD